MPKTLASQLLSLGHNIFTFDYDLLILFRE